MTSTDGEGLRAPRPDPQVRSELLVAPAAILDGLPDAVVAIAPDGRIVFVNALAEERKGNPFLKLLGSLRGAFSTALRIRSMLSCVCTSASLQAACSLRVLR